MSVKVAKNFVHAQNFLSSETDSDKAGPCQLLVRFALCTVLVRYAYVQSLGVLRGPLLIWDGWNDHNAYTPLAMFRTSHSSLIRSSCVCGHAVDICFSYVFARSTVPYTVALPALFALCVYAPTKRNLPD